MLVSWVSELFVATTPPPFITSYNDSIAALASGTMGELHGIVLIAGTGQMGKGLNKRAGTEWTAGGNGGLIDDGSGFGMAVDVARAAFQAADGMGPMTPILQSVLSLINATNVEALVPWLYGEFSWGHVAQLAPIAFQHADNDPVAKRIVEKHAAYLCRAAHTIIDKLQFDSSESLTVVLCGGLLQQPLMAQLVSASITERLPNANITPPKVDPAHGAALLAITQASSLQ